MVQANQQSKIIANLLGEKTVVAQLPPKTEKREDPGNEACNIYRLKSC